MPPGPLPKADQDRRRRNAPTFERVELPASGRRGRPPKIRSARTVFTSVVEEWWRDLWASPMATQFLPADIHTLSRLAELKDDYAVEPNVKLLTEIKQLEDRYGLNPKSRRELRWAIVDDSLLEAAPPAVRPAGRRERLLKVVDGAS